MEKCTMDNYQLVREKWPQILERLKEDCEMSVVSFDAWIRPLEVYKVDNSRITLLFPGETMGINILNKKYTLPLKVAIAEITNLNLDIHYITSDR